MRQAHMWILGLAIIGLHPLDLIAQSGDDRAVAPSEFTAGASGTPLVCPGGFPTDLTVTNCLYTMKDRADAFIENSVTDKSILGAVVFGAGAQVVQSPGEWKRTWDGYGRRVGVRYNQAVAKGAAEFLVGALMHDDPRNISYSSDPRIAAKRMAALKANGPGLQGADQYAEPSKATLAKRIGHAFFDSITVRRSSLNGNGARMPAISRLVGAYASGYGGYAWYAAAENTFKNASLRAAQSFGTDVGASFYTEFSPEVSKLLGAIFKRGRQSRKTATGTAASRIDPNEVTAE